MTKKIYWENKCMELTQKVESIQSQFKEMKKFMSQFQEMKKVMAEFQVMKNSIEGQQEKISKLKVKLKDTRIKLKKKIKTLESKLQSTGVTDPPNGDVSTELVVSTETGGSTETYDEQQFYSRNGDETTDYEDSEYFNDYLKNGYDDSYEHTDNAMSDVTMNFHKDGYTTDDMDTSAYDDIIDSVAGGKLGGGVVSFSCTKCPKFYKIRQSFLKHMKTHEKRPFNCTECAEYFEEESQLDLHVQKHVEDRSKVEQPSMTTAASSTSNTASSNSQSQQQKTKTPKRTPTPRIPNPGDSICRICTAAFAKPIKLTLHFKSLHPSEKAFKCTTCSNSFEFKNEYNHHMRSHRPKKVVKSSSQPSTPRKTSHNFNPGKQLHQCMICNKVFRKEELLYKHFELHSATEESGGGTKVSRQKKRSSQSERVSKPVVQDDSYEANDVSHDPTVLNFTDDQNSQAANRNEDISEEMTFLCSFCDDGIPFSDRKSLLKHVNEEHGWQKGFKCQFCPKSYFTSHFLKRHIEARHSRSIQSIK